MKITLPIESFLRFEASRRKGLHLSDDLRIASKIAIGFLLSDELEKATESLFKAENLFTELRELVRQDPYLYSIGGILVGTEEYVEARLLADYLSSTPLSTLEELEVEHDAYIGGLSDMSGELLRYARKHPEQMKTILKDLETLNQSCLELIVTRNGSIRKKLSDLEHNMKKLEEMIFSYDLKHS